MNLAKETQIKIVELYRSFRSNPKIKLSNEDRELLLSIVDRSAFDVNMMHIGSREETIRYAVVYKGYLTGSFTNDNVPVGSQDNEDIRIPRVLASITTNINAKIMLSYLKGNIPDIDLINAAYIEMGLTYKLIPSLAHISSTAKSMAQEAYLEQLKKGEQ